MKFVFFSMILECWFKAFLEDLLLKSNKTENQKPGRSSWTIYPSAIGVAVSHFFRLCAWA